MGAAKSAKEGGEQRQKADANDQVGEGDEKQPQITPASTIRLDVFPIFNELLHEEYLCVIRVSE